MGYKNSFRTRRLGDWGRVKSVSKDRKRLPKVLSTNGFGTGRVSWYVSRHIRLNV